MLEVLTVTARPLAPPTPAGKKGAYGIWEAHAHLSNGETVWGRGLDRQSATRNAGRAARRAARQWAEVLRFLDEETRFQEALDLGLVDARD